VPNDLDSSVSIATKAKKKKKKMVVTGTGPPLITSSQHHTR
jgi:hypothetical protein